MERAEKEATKKVSTTEMYLADIEKTKKEIERKKKIKKKVFEEFAEGNLTSEEYIEYRESYAKEEKELQLKLSNLEQQVAKRKDKGALELPWINHLLEHKEVKELTREIVVQMVDEILIFDDKRIKITYNFTKEYENLLKIVG